MNERAVKKKKIKVVHFIWSIPHYRRPIFQRLSRNDGIDFVVCAGDNTKMYDGANLRIVTKQNDPDGYDFKINLVRSWRVKWRLFRDFEWQPGSIIFLLKNDFDVVICLGNKSFSNMLIRFICKFKRIPLIEWTQGVNRREYGIKWFGFKCLYRLADVILLYGSLARDFFVEHGFRASRIFVVNNSLDYDSHLEAIKCVSADAINEVREKFNVCHENSRLIFFSGRLLERTRLDLLFEAMDIVIKKGVDIHLVVIGDGECRDEFEAKVKALGIGAAVSFFGACYDEISLAKIMIASDLCVLPGHVGLSAIHSLVYGTPILTCKGYDWSLTAQTEDSVVTSLGHSPEVEAIREGETGDFYEGGNVCSLAEKLEGMLYPLPCKLQMEDECKRVIADNYTPAFQEDVIISAINCVLPESKRISV